MQTRRLGNSDLHITPLGINQAWIPRMPSESR
jgi:hypothetical protein